ncbi:MAG: hypothetical protein ABJZ55_21570 [Fuerstiella sp.]
MKRFQTAVLLFVLSVVGCSQSDDFSSPPAQLAAARAKSRSKQADTAKPQTKAPEAASKDKQGKELGAAEAEPTRKATTDVANVAVQAPGNGSGTKATTKPAISPPDTTTAAQDDTKARATKSAETAEKSSMQQDSMEAAKATRLGNEKPGVSFLDSLQTENTKKKPAAAKKSPRRRGVVEKTGRFAVSLRAWLNLKLAMSKRFFVASTDDATHIAASTGERSLGVLSTRVENLGQELNFVRTQRTVVANLRSKTEITVQPVRNFPASITCLELIDHGNVALAGTEDGRLIARSCANLQDWDIYSQDLFTFQDEHRPATRISESGIAVVRVVGKDRILTVDGDGACRIWKTSDVVQSPIPVLELTAKQVASPEADTKTANAIAEIQLPTAQVLSLMACQAKDLCAVVTSDEIVTIFKSTDGSPVASFNADDFDDTQPVAVWFEEQSGRILAGLADGRIIRRALPGGTPVQGVDDTGAETDYEVLFSPSRTDRSGAVTALAVTDEGSFLHIGRMDGAVTKFDLPRKQVVSSAKIHKQAVLEIRATSNGVLSLGDDRLAYLSEIPTMAHTPVASGAHRPPKSMTQQKFNLPKDDSLPTRVVTTDQVEGEQDKFTRPRNLGRNISTGAAEIQIAGIRPADTHLALLEHQLRVAGDDRVRASIRSQIIDIRQSQEKAVPPPIADYSAREPVQRGEILTQLDYTTRPLRPVSMTLSNDGSTVAATQYFKPGQTREAASQAIFAWDLSSQTVLRTWRRLPGVYSLGASWSEQMLIPTPLTAHLNLQSGQLRTDLSAQNSTFAWSSDRQQVAVGRKGVAGKAVDIVAIHSVTEPAAIATGVEAFEGIVGAIAYSHDQNSLFVSIREKTRVRLLEVDSHSLAVINELVSEPISGTWNLARVDRTDAVGATMILPSPSGKFLVTYGRYEKDYQLRIWKKSGNKWPKEKVTVIPSRQALMDVNSISEPIRFVNSQDNLLGIVGDEGIATIDPRSGNLKESLPVPDVDDRRPVILLSNDGRFAFSGDADGVVWVTEMKSLERRPRKWVAQAGAITGLTMSPDGKYLATAGQENRIRVWDIAEFLNGPTKTAAK